MNPVFTYRVHKGALQVVLRGRGPDYRGVIEVGRLVQEYRTELAFKQTWYRRARQFDEWYALKQWWKCQTSDEYDEVKRVFGATLTRALEKWHQTDRYKRNKARYQK